MMMKPITFSTGTIETLKWTGLALMTGDHINKYLFNATLPGLFEIGRLCLPIFVIVLAFNLAQPRSIDRNVHIRAMKKLLTFGAVASMPFVALGGLYAGWWPLNVLFTLLTITTTIYFVEKGGTQNHVMAAIIFIIGGGVVEYWWPAIALGVASWSYFKHPKISSALLIFTAIATLWIINHNWWALASMPLIVFFSRFELRIPRLRWVFYAYYPAHLAVIWLIRIPMRKAGYLFF